MKGFRSLHFGLKHRIISYLSQNWFRQNTYTVRHGLAAGMRRKGGLGFVPISSLETPEERFLRSLPLEGKVVYDIGAFEGVLTLYFASRAKQVIAYEPNPRNYAHCVENVRLNHLENVQVRNHGVADTPGSINLVYDPLMPGAGSGRAAIKQQIDSSVKTATTVEIPILPLDIDIVRYNLPPPDIIKIDIEGMELPALRGMQQTLLTRHPALYIEMHGATRQDKIQNAHAVTELLELSGYRMYDVEAARYLDGKILDNYCPSHLYCTPVNN